MTYIFRYIEKKRPNCLERLPSVSLIDCNTCQFILFGMGVSKGDPYRILAGTDVAGNTCGRSNDPISGVSHSGQSLQGRQYLYYDWIKTAKIIGDQALTSSIDGLNLLGDNTSGKLSVKMCDVKF